jgi:arginyl-tRNA synthetase
MSSVRNKKYANFSHSKMIYVVASQQDLHLAQLFKIEELMGRKDISERCQHINFGMVLG